MTDTHLASVETRRATNVTLPEALVAEARKMKINVSQACEAGLAAQVANERRKRWLEENRAAIDEYNERIEREGLILAEYQIV
jgi:antitoxin CcdA